MNTTQHTINWKAFLKYGLLAGLVIVYVSAVGMLEAFNEREVIRDVVTLGQLLIVGAPFFISLIITQHLEKDAGNIPLPARGLIIGAIASIPPVVLVGLTQVINFRPILVNINRGMVEVLTFENESLLVGSLILAAVMTVAGLAGSSITLLPAKPRRALLIGLIWVLGVGVMSELVTGVLSEHFSRDFERSLFERDTLKATTAAGLFLITTLIALGWGYSNDDIKKQYRALPTSSQQIARGSGFLLLGLFLIVLPQIVGSALSETLSIVGLFMLMGLGLNIAIGLAGLLDLGYVTNYAVGAYVMAVMTSTGALGLAEKTGVDFLNFWIVLPISVIAAMITGFIFAVPVLRMRGDYLAIATLGFGEIIRILALSDWLAPIIGGAQGVLFIPNPTIDHIVLWRGGQIIAALLIGHILRAFIKPDWQPSDNIYVATITKFAAYSAMGLVISVAASEIVRAIFFSSLDLSGQAIVRGPQQIYYVILGAAILALTVSVRLNNSRTGRQWMAIREDEDVAAAMGISTARAKLLAFTISAATGGLAGGILAVKLGTVFPTSFNLLVSINVLSLIIIGGMGSIPGIILGALFLLGLPELLREFEEFRLLLYGALLVAMMLLRPEGLWPSAVRRRELADDDSVSTAPAVGD
ncbi:MAG: hypothetical protein D6737_04780 [Chloroflexi bacterium]|nr:MAG: hypothetical protein D6737_04780 [Chloroflexota bacterium]